MNAEQLEQWCMGKDVDKVTDLLKNKYNARFVDEKIDDGGDEEGTYVKKRVLSLKGGYIDLYYLDTDGIISYVDVDTDGIMESKKKKCGVVKISENQLRGIIAESVKGVLKEYGYDSHPESGYEPFDKIGEGAAYWVMDKLKKEYANDVDSEAIERIISEFGYSLKALADVGDIDNGVRGFGIKL